MTNYPKGKIVRSRNPFILVKPCLIFGTGEAVATSNVQDRPAGGCCGDTRTFSDDFCIGYAECPPYFYFRSSRPTDLESVSRDAHLAVTVSTKFEVDTTIRCLVIALLLLIRYVTL